jgi:hypothetical protein
VKITYFKYRLPCSSLSDMITHVSAICLETWESEIQSFYYNVHGSVYRNNILIQSNKMQCYTVYFIWKLLYVFRVVPPIIKSANNCIYSIWYWSHRYCLAADGSNGLTNTRCCRYSCLRSWWWVVYHPKHVEQFPNKINRVTLHLVGYILE